MSTSFMEGSSFNKIANEYHTKRKKPWRPLEFFINFLKSKNYSFRGILLDLGCANGRNFKIMNSPPNKLVGIDISLNLLKIANSNLKNTVHFSPNESKYFQLVQADIINLPIRDKSINTIFSIATIHHIRKKSERKSTLIQMHEILKEKGKLVLTVWRKWQKKFRDFFLLEWIRRNFSLGYKNQQKMRGLEEFGDKYVPWTLKKQNDVYNRFYHFFSKRELKKLVKIFKILEFKIMGGPNNRDNFFIFVQKS
ncbi:MAG: class I SAM-dependent methyltransferase [Promethearchaeota archaeon]